MAHYVRLKVKYGGGMSPEADWGKTGLDGYLDFKDDRLVVTLLSQTQQKVTTYEVSDLRFVSYQSADIGFRTGSLITVGFPDNEGQFLIREPVPNPRAPRQCRQRLSEPAAPTSRRTTADTDRTLLTRRRINRLPSQQCPMNLTGSPASTSGVSSLQEHPSKTTTVPGWYTAPEGKLPYQAHWDGKK